MFHEEKSNPEDYQKYTDSDCQEDVRVYLMETILESISLIHEEKSNFMEKNQLTMKLLMN